MTPRPHAGFQLEEDLEHERREWVVQRIGWGLMVGLLLAGLLGLFGNGPLSRTSRTDPRAALRVEYDRFLRAEMRGQLHVTLAPDSSSERVVSIDEPLLRRLRLQQVVPEPLRVESVDDEQHFVFAARPGESVTITFDVQPQEAGPISGRIRIANGPSVAVRQLVYP